MADTDRVSDMSKGELRQFIREAVQDSIQELLWYLEQFEPDPDAGLELRPEFVQELRARQKRWENRKSLEEVKRELGLEDAQSSSLRSTVNDIVEGDKIVGGDVIGTGMRTTVFFKPGEIASESGQYEIVGPRGGDTGEIVERTVVSGEPFPPTPKPGQRYRITDRTRTQGRKK